MTYTLHTHYIHITYTLHTHYIPLHTHYIHITYTLHTRYIHITYANKLCTYFIGTQNADRVAQNLEIIKRCQRTGILPRDSRSVPINNVELIINPMRILVRLVLKLNFFTTDSVTYLCSATI